MCKQLKGQKGFTLIELMIVVAIIGILAAIAIPNFLTYQLKSRQAEAKTNLQAIKTSEVAFQAERGCYIGVAVEGVAAPAGRYQNSSIYLGCWCCYQLLLGALVCCAAGVFGGAFTDIGFKATGNVNYHYGVDSTVVAAPGLYTTALLVLWPLLGLLLLRWSVGMNNFVAVAKSNLDGDAADYFNLGFHG